MSKTVWIAQMKCPGNHCILAAADEAETRGEAERLVPKLQAVIKAALSRGALNPWCGLCGAQANTWKVDLRRTAFASLYAAELPLRAAEAENRQAAAVFGDLHRRQKPN